MLPLLTLLACVRPAPPAVATGSTPLPAPMPDRPTRVILMIGDGMGPQQLGLLETWARLGGDAAWPDGRTAFRRLADQGHVGLSLHHPEGGLVTDSACSATQLALGRPSRNGLIGVDADGNRQQNLRERAADLGWATGIVSDTRLTHATPAAFLAHVGSRREERAIAAQTVASDVQVALSGGRAFFLPGEDDDSDLLAVAGAAGFDVVDDAAGLAAAGPRVLGLFGERSMPDALEARSSELPTLATLTQAALTRLDADEDGFFLMVEGGQIDWAAHYNDAGWMLAELERFDAAVAVALDYAMSHPDTLLVVTADHETGGFGLSPSSALEEDPIPLGGEYFPEGYTPYENLPVGPLVQLHRQPYPITELLDGELDSAELRRRVQEDWGWALTEEQAATVLSGTPLVEGLDHYPATAAGAYFAVSRALSGQTGVVWNTSGHTHTPVPVLAMGPGSESFVGLLHHVEVGQRLAELVAE